MKEFGDRGAEFVTLLCTKNNCPRNMARGTHTSEHGVALARNHEFLEGHESVVVHHGRSSRITPFDAMEVYLLTGVEVSRNIVV